MKISKTLMVALLCSGVGAATAQQSGVINERTPDYQTRTQHDSSLTSDANLMEKIRVVEKRSLDNDLTANNVIGENVYGTDGEQIGKIHDLKLEGQKFTQLRQQFLTGKRDLGDRTSRAADSVERTGDRVADSVERAGERTADAIDRSQDRSSDTLDRADRTADRVDRSAERAADRIDRTTEQAQRDLERASQHDRDAWSTTDSIRQEGTSQLYAVIQTGGVLGIGADYFVVPFDQLRYDASEERFQLSITQSQLEQIRNQPASARVGPSASL